MHAGCDGEQDKLPNSDGPDASAEESNARGERPKVDVTPSTPTGSEQPSSDPPDGRHSIDDAPRAGDSDDRLLRRIDDTIGSAIDRVLEAFDNKLAYDASKQRQVDLLHEELQQHRTGLVARTVRPLIHAMIHHHNTIARYLTAVHERADGSMSCDEVTELLEGLQEDVEMVLAQNGVAAYRTTDSSFDPRRQRMLKKMPTDDKSRAGTIAESLRPGFELGTDILEKEGVCIYELPSSPKSQGSTS